MLTGLDWISDGEKVITDRHGVAVGMVKMFKCPYHKQSEKTIQQYSMWRVTSATAS